MQDAQPAASQVSTLLLPPGSLGVFSDFPPCWMVTVTITFGTEYLPYLSLTPCLVQRAEGKLRLGPCPKDLTA